MPMGLILQFGRHPKLSLAEAKALFPDTKFLSRSTGESAEADLRKVMVLGGTVRAMTEIAEDVDRGKTITDYLERTGLGKVTFGLGVLDSKLTAIQLERLGFDVKNALKSKRIAARFITKKQLLLNGATVKANRLADKNFEFVIIGRKIALTRAIQDIDDFSKRDYGRPCRNTKVGMLPPKLARMLVNLSRSEKIYDPFCGSGAVLQEAVLVNKEAWGSDISQEMADCTNKNLEWLASNYRLEVKPHQAWAADATEINSLPERRAAIVTEGFLGPALLKKPGSNDEQEALSKLNAIYSDFLQSVSRTNVSRLIICSPYYVGSEKGLNIVDFADRLGYNIIPVIGETSYVYHRPDQFVGREIFILER